MAFTRYLKGALAATPLLLGGCNSSGDFDLNIFREGYFAPKPRTTVKRVTENIIEMCHEIRIIF